MIARAAGSLLLSLVTTIPAFASMSGEWRFRVYLDDKEIGYHHFTLTPAGESLQLSSKARFDVTFLKVPLYRYRHNSTEWWDSNCLRQITSSTSSNGKSSQLEGAVEGNAFLLNTGEDVTRLPGCISSFAYWNRKALDRARLLNPQTGDYAEAELEYLGQDSVAIGGIATAAHRYRLRTDDHPIELWYSLDNEWVALESSVTGDRSLRYVIE